jgi:molybdopterin converting factor small subunit
VDHALRAVVHDHPGLHRVLPACSFLVDGTRATAGTSLDDGAVLDVLPPFSGG